MSDTAYVLQILAAIADNYFKLRQVDDKIDTLSRLIKLEIQRIYREEQGRLAEYEPWIKHAQRLLLSVTGE